ncbi:MAG: pentapeptide repeat-containing protein [Methylobacter sp.]|jgi:hypothetical protein
MADDEHIAVLNQGVKFWNQWRKDFPDIRPNLAWADLTQITLTSPILSFNDLNLTRATLTGAKLVGADLTGANLTGADLSYADLTGADLSFVNINSTKFRAANFSNTYVMDIKWNSHTMRGNYHGVRGLDSCYGNGVFKRAALDQVYLDSLESHWAGTWKAYLFRAWGWIDYGRSLSILVFYASLVVVLYGFIYSLCPELLHWPEPLDCKQSVKYLDDHQIPASWFTPFYFSIVTYTTLGFGDIHPQNLIGEIIVSSEVIIGYLTLGLLLSVLAEKVARRS